LEAIFSTSLLAVDEGPPGRWGGSGEVAVQMPLPSA
jgi:hypothetical protein